MRIGCTPAAVSALVRAWRRRYPVAAETLHRTRDLLALRRGTRIAFVTNQSDFIAKRRKAHVGSVVPQQQPVLSARGEQAVRFPVLLADEVIQHHADVRLIAPQHDRRFVLHAAGRVDTGNESLRRRLFIAGSTVDLAREEEAGHRLGLQRDARLVRDHVVVFDGIAVAHDLRATERGHGAQHVRLHVFRQARVRALHVDLMRGKSFRLKKKLVGILLRKAHDLVLDRGAVAGPQFH